MSDGNDKWRIWDNACERDEPRNQFVIPYLAGELEARKPTLVMDIGAGSGYISRRLIQLSASPAPEWILVDAEPAACHWLTTRFADQPRVDVRHSRVPPFPSLRANPTLVFFSYTTLEMSLSEIIEALGSLTAQSTLIIFIPDVVEDVLAATGLGTQAFWSGGSIRIPKIDKFTGLPYLFIAYRIERLLEILTTLGFTVKRFSRYSCRQSHHAHYAITAQKLPG